MTAFSLIKSMAVLIIFLYIPPAGRSQQTGYIDGYIITNSNDTVYGLVKIRETFPFVIREDVKFKKTEDSKPRSYYADEIKGFTAFEDVYISKEFGKKKTTYFFRWIIKGYLNYYLTEYGNTAGNNMIMSHAILQKNGENEWHLDGGLSYPFKNKMMEYLKDAPALCDKIRTGIYNANHMEKIVTEYNKLHPVTDKHNKFNILL